MVKDDTKRGRERDRWEGGDGRDAVRCGYGKGVIEGII
jgi:hypothetical protein